MDQTKEVRLVPARHYTKRSERGKLVAAWVSSGLSAEEFAQQCGVSSGTLHRWRRRAGVPRPEVGLVEVPVMATNGWVAEVSSKLGPVHLSASAPPSWAAALIQELNRC